MEFAPRSLAKGTSLKPDPVPEPEPEPEPEPASKPFLPSDVTAQTKADHPTWVDDERSPNCCSTVYHRHATQTPCVRPLWQDVLWGRARHGGAEAEAEDRGKHDTSLYVDHEFDSGRGSPVPDGAYDDW